MRSDQVRGQIEDILTDRVAGVVEEFAGVEGVGELAERSELVTIAARDAPHFTTRLAHWFIWHNEAFWRNRQSLPPLAGFAVVVVIGGQLRCRRIASSASSLK